MNSTDEYLKCRTEYSVAHTIFPSVSPYGPPHKDITIR